MPKTATNPLSDRLEALAITPAELATIVGRSVEEVEGWVNAEAPLGGEAAVLVRFLADAADAQRRVGQLRRTHTRDLRGDGMAYAGIDPDKLADRTPPVVTGGRPA